VKINFTSLKCLNHEVDVLVSFMYVAILQDVGLFADLHVFKSLSVGGCEYCYLFYTYGHMNMKY